MSEYGDSQSFLRPPFRRHTPAAGSGAETAAQPPAAPLNSSPASRPTSADAAALRQRSLWREYQQWGSPYAAASPAAPSPPPPGRKPLQLPSPPPLPPAVAAPPAGPQLKSSPRRQRPQPTMPAAFSAPPQSLPPQSLPPQSLSPQSLPPQSLPPQSLPPQPAAMPVRPGWRTSEADASPLSQLRNRLSTPRPTFRSARSAPGTAFRPAPLTNGSDSTSAIPEARAAQPGRTNFARNNPSPNNKVTPLHRPGRTAAASLRTDRAAPSPRRSPRKTPLPILYAVRLLILGVGVAAIAGTLLSALSPNQVNAPRPGGDRAVAAAATGSREGATLSDVRLSEELGLLKADLDQLSTLAPRLNQATFALNLNSGQYVDLNGSEPVAAASTIKLPVMIAFLQAVDAGTVKLDQALVLESRHLAAGSGALQDQAVGSTYSALQIATEMIINSDNSATNMLIELLGGAEVLNQQFLDWGLTQTAIASPLPDLQGTNTTSPRDLALLLALVDQGEVLSLRSRDRLFSTLQRTVNRTLIPSGLSEGAISANKTGDIASVLGDIALVDTPQGERYILATLIKRPDNDGRASELIRRISERVYREFSQPLVPTGAAPISPANLSPAQPSFTDDPALESAPSRRPPTSGSQRGSDQPSAPNPESDPSLAPQPPRLDSGSDSDSNGGSGSDGGSIPEG